MMSRKLPGHTLTVRRWHTANLGYQKEKRSQKVEGEGCEKLSHQGCMRPNYPICSVGKSDHVTSGRSRVV